MADGFAAFTASLLFREERRGVVARAGYLEADVFTSWH